MVRNRKPMGTAMSMPAGVVIGTLAALGWTVLWAAILAKLMEWETLPEDAVGYGAMVILLSGSFLGSLTAVWKVKSKRLQVSMLTAAGYYLSLLAMTALFFGGQYTGMGVTGLLIVGGSGTSVLLGMGTGKGKRPRGYQKIKI